MQQWEYQVIHLNVDSSGPGKEGPSPPPDTPTTTPPFTKGYLEQEFPAHYGPQQPPGSAAPTPTPQTQHPAVQLQGFINSHGRQGWELLGIFPLGSLLMMIFRRPLPAETGAGTQPGLQARTTPTAAAAPTEPIQHPGVEASLRAILSRLEALEHRLAASARGSSASDRPVRQEPPTTAAAPAPSAAPVPPNQARRPATTSTWILRQDQLSTLGVLPACSTAQAASSLGFRSAASLLNQASKHGYPIGLVRIGPNGKAAVYQGLAANRRGGKDLRLWLVLDSNQLPPEPD